MHLWAVLKINFSLQAGAYYEPFSMMSISSCGQASDRSSTDNARPSTNLSLTCLKHSWSQRNACLAGLIVIQACLKALVLLVSLSAEEMEPSGGNAVLGGEGRVR